MNDLDQYVKKLRAIAKQAMKDVDEGKESITNAADRIGLTPSELEAIARSKE